MPSITHSDICYGGKGISPMGYNRHWNEVKEVSEQVIEGIPMFSGAIPQLSTVHR